MKLTKWYPANIKPVHIGEYEIQALPNVVGLRNFRAFWNGYFFVYVDSREVLFNQNRIWRGVRK